MKYTKEEDYLDLPYHLSMRKCWSKENGWSDRWYRNYSHPINHYFPWTIIKRVLRDNIGNSVDIAFSKYCKLVPKYMQHLFLEEINDIKDENKRRWWVRRGYGFRINEHNIITYIPKKNEPIILYSNDYKIEWRHKITNSLKPNVHKYINLKNRYHVSIYRVLHSSYGWINAFEEDFKKVVSYSWKLEVSSRNDYRYKRIMKEKEKQRKKLKREKQAKDKLIQYSFISKDEIRLKKEKEENLMKIIKHGFYPVTSFRTDKQTNPDLIHLKQ